MSIINTGKSPIKVTPRDSVDDSVILANAQENLGLIPQDNWIAKCAQNDETAWMASAGPSLERLLKLGFMNRRIFDDGQGHILFCVKHSLPVLVNNGYNPHFCIALDPRPIEGISTHGRLRSSLYGSANPKITKFLIASMTHPSVTKFLIRNGYQVFGWHSAANGLIDKDTHKPKLKEIRSMISGGTCSATRCIGMSHYMGFRKINLVGLDSNLASPPDNPDEIDTSLMDEAKGKSDRIKKYWQVSIGNSPNFWTTGELIAQIQDLEQFLGNDLSDMEINILGADKETSLVGALNEAVVNKTKLFKHYSKQTGDFS